MRVESVLTVPLFIDTRSWSAGVMTVMTESGVETVRHSVMRLSSGFDVQREQASYGLSADDLNRMRTCDKRECPHPFTQPCMKLPLIGIIMFLRFTTATIVVFSSYKLVPINSWQNHHTCGGDHGDPRRFNILATFAIK